MLGSWSWSLPTNSKASDASWAFVSWLTSKQGETRRVLKGGAPVRSSVLTDPTVRAKGYGSAYYDTVKQLLQNSSPLSEGPNGEEMIQAVGTQLNSAVAGQTTVALATADSKAKNAQNG